MPIVLFEALLPLSQGPTDTDTQADGITPQISRSELQSVSQPLDGSKEMHRTLFLY